MSLSTFTEKVKDEKARKKIFKIAALLLLLLIVLFFVWKSGPLLEVGKIEHNPAGLSMDDLQHRLYDNQIFLPAGQLLVTQQRADYVAGDLRLVVPKLELDTPVYEDTTQKSLAKGPCLYKYSQLPDLYNTNVSIAGHRDLPQYDFYYLDLLSEGDQIYLVYKNIIFSYLYRETTEVEKNDWDPIRVFYDNRVTLTTCTPLGTARKRMIVVGDLQETLEYSDTFVFE